MEYHCQNFTKFTYSNIVTNDLGMTLYQSCSNCIILQEMAILSGASFFLSIKRKTKSWRLFLAGLFFEINLFNAYYCKVSADRYLTIIGIEQVDFKPLLSSVAMVSDTSGPIYKYCIYCGKLIYIFK